MSTNELRDGRPVSAVVYPDDRTVGLDEDVTSMTVCYVPGQGGMVPWIRVIGVDGKTALINVEHVAVVEFE